MEYGFLLPQPAKRYVENHRNNLFSDKDHFLHPDKKSFDKERIIEFLNEKGIALYDTASAVRRLQDNASDKFLEIIEPTDIDLLLKQLPNVGQSLPQVRRQQIHYANKYMYQNLLLEENPPLNTTTVHFIYTECLHPVELIH